MASIEIIHVGDKLRKGRVIKIGRQSFDEAYAARGIDVEHQIRLLKRRARYAQQQDRRKTFAGSNALDNYCGYWRKDICYTPDHASRDLAVLRNPGGTAEYVAAWCRLNNLTQ